MRRVVNGLIIDRKRKEVLLLQKPRRQFWYAPGGKADPQESLGEAIAREIYEEAGLTITHPKLGAVMTIIQEQTSAHRQISTPELPTAHTQEQALPHEEHAMKSNETLSWMLFTFVIDRYQGNARDVCEEGILSWHPIDHLKHLPMPAGDRLVLWQLAQAEDDAHTLTGKFRYTEEGELLSYHLDDAGYFKEMWPIEHEPGS
ncbi:MAG: NUDIX domain-containing protein [Candidatus Carbobacillus altaicus]|nr:NUDIX domain-containing protein [Candidatus Carbobacillus altaicus]